MIKYNYVIFHDDDDDDAHLCRVICKSHQGFKDIYIVAETIVCLTLNYDLTSKWPWSNMRSAHPLRVFYMCAKSSTLQEL